MSERVFEQEINELLTLVGCIHTNARRKLKTPKKGTVEGKYIPFGFYTDGVTTWTAQAIRDTFSEYLWQEVVEIDGHKIDTILGELMKFHPSDGYNTTFMTHLLSSGASFGNLYHYYFGTDSLVRFSFVEESGDTVNVDIPKLGSKKKTMVEKTKPSEKWTLHVKNHYYKEEDNWALLKVSSFNPFKHKTRKFYKDLFRSLSEQNIGHLVIDVRHNLGGSINDANTILKHILDEDFVVILERYKAPTFKYSNTGSRVNYVLFTIKRSLELRKKYTENDKKIAEFKVRTSSKNNFDGQVYVLTNGYSASSSSYMATLLKQKENAMIIGDETGGGAAGNNGLYYTKVQLPNSRIQVRIPFYWLDYQLIPDKGRGVMPDVPIRYKIEDLKLKKDLEMEWVKNYFARYDN